MLIINYWPASRNTSTRSTVATHFDRLNYDDVLEEGQEERLKPGDRLVVTPLHAVQDGEESGHDDAQKDH